MCVRRTHARGSFFSAGDFARRRRRGELLASGPIRQSCGSAAVPGWSLAIVNYYTSVSAGGNVAAAREITIGRFNPTVNVSLNANLKADAELVLVNPSYAFATPVLGGQFTLG